MDSYLNEFHENMDHLNFTYFDRDDFRLSNLMGSGHIGEVYDGVIVTQVKEIPIVIKRLLSSSYSYGPEDDCFYDDVLSEVTIRNKIKKSKNIIEFYGYSVKVVNKEVIIYIIMEKTSAIGDISKYIEDHEFWVELTEREYNGSNSHTLLSHEGEYWDYIMSQKDKVNLMVKMCEALKELHSSNVVHADIKPHNMLYDGTNVKLIDFNASVYMGDAKELQGKEEQGTPGYMAKEMYSGEITYKSDIYALGVSFLHVWFGDIWPTETGNPAKNRRYVLDYLSLLENDNPVVYDIIKRCVSVSQSKRPDLSDILEILTTI